MSDSPTKAPIAGAVDRAPAVQAMFNQLAPKYDMGNRVLSLGLDQWWRRQAINSLAESRTGTVLDLCSGTMDLTRMLVSEGAHFVHAADFSEQMLAVGEQKMATGEPYKIHCCDARKLPFEDASMDAIIAGFGLRNVPEVEVALQECARVLKPGGRLAVLDFFQPVGFIPRLLQDSYNKIIVPVVGGLITGSAASYRYLNESIDAFCTADQFVALLAEVGIDAEARVMLPPVAHLISGSRRAE